MGKTMDRRGQQVRRVGGSSFRVDAGDARQAYELVRRLRRFEPELVARGEGFTLLVRLTGTRPSPLPELLAATRRWMIDEAVESTRVEIDGRPQIIRRQA